MSNRDMEPSYTGLEIAVIGLECKFPGADNVDQFWNNLKFGVEGITFFSDQELIESGVAPALCQDPNYVKAKGYLKDTGHFDPNFFDYTSHEAAALDPQVRIFHECALHALEHAGYNSETYSGQIGLYAGSTMNTNWLMRQLLAEEYSTFNLSFREYLCTSISYKLKLKGPSVSVLTACSTSLVAVHMACQALLNGECSMALAGGVNISLPSRKGYYYTDDLIYSPDGHCRAFDASSQGTLISDGAGIIVLKTLQDALNDGDSIHAVIKGSAVNNDGSRKVGFSAPSIQGQKEVIETALHMAEVEPESITMLEAHGTGTRIGDSIEVEALRRAYKTTRKGYCAIGSVKSNIGHLNEAAGIAGLIKAILSLTHRQIPPTLHVMNPNPKIEFENSPFYVNHGLTDWTNDQSPLRAAVSSFGIGGTNAHLILEEAPPVSGKLADPAQGELFVLSAKTESALRQQVSQFKEFILTHPHVQPSDVAYTLQVGRMAHPYRSYFMAREYGEMIDELNSATYSVSRIEKSNRTPLYIFPELTGDRMILRQGFFLYETHPQFKREVTACLAQLEAYPNMTIHALSRTELLNWQDRQVLQLVFDTAFGRMLLDVCGKQQGVLGIKSGHLTAAVLAGVIPIERAVVYLLGQDLQTLTAYPIEDSAIRFFSITDGSLISGPSLGEAEGWNTLLHSSLSYSISLEALCGNPDNLTVWLGSGEADTIHRLAKDGVKFDPSMESSFLNLLGAMWQAGAEIRWEKLYIDRNNIRVPLPTYPFERKHYLLEEVPSELTIASLRQQSLQSAVAKAPADPTTGLYLPVWKRWGRSGQKLRDEPLETALIFCHDSLEDTAKHAYQQAVRAPLFITAGNPVGGAQEDTYLIGEHSREGYIQVLQQLLNRSGALPPMILFHCMTTMNEPEMPYTDEHLYGSFYSLLHLIQALDSLNVMQSIRLAIITNHICDVTGDEQLQPWKATVVGLIKAIPLEYPDIKCRLIDISSRENTLSSDLLRSVLSETNWSAEEDVIAYRGQYKWTPSYEKYEQVLPVQTSLSVKNEGVYLITGGTGGIGLELADFLAGQQAATIILIGRSTFPPEADWEQWIGTHSIHNTISMKINKIRQIRQKGTHIAVIQTDVTQYDQLKQTIDRIKQRFGPIHGVIHAAGLPGGGLIPLQNAQMSGPVLRTKINGCLYLDQLLQDQPLDFFVLCSSVSTLFPLPGQADYNAANAFLDAYAASRITCGNYPIISLKWDTWKETGMALYSSSRDHPLISMEHPLWDEVIQGAEEDLYYVRLSIKKNWVLQDHRTDSYGILSGTAMLEMIREAAEQKGIVKPLSLDDIHFISPVTVQDDEEKEVCLILSSDGLSTLFTCYSRHQANGNWIAHATGSLTPLEEPAADMTNLAHIRERCHLQEIVFSEWEHDRHSGYLTFGERWRNIRQVMLGVNEGLAMLELPKPYREDLQEYQLHPGMLDSATSFLLGFLGKTSMYAPLSYKQLKVYDRLPPIIYSHCRYLDEHDPQDDVVHFDIQIMDEQGKLLADITSYTMIAVSDATLDRIGTAGAAPGSSIPLQPDALLRVSLNGIGASLPYGLTSAQGQSLFSQALGVGESSIILSAGGLRSSRLSGKEDVHNLASATSHSPPLVPTEDIRPALSVTYTAPQAGTEQRLVELFERFLGISPIGINDHFFHLGGDSLKAIHLCAEIRKQFHFRLTLAEFFDHSTVQAVSRLMDAERTSDAATIRAAEPKSAYPASMAQKRIFFLQEAFPGTTGYNESTAVLLEGDVDAVQIEGLFMKLMERHESLRTSFMISDGEIVQVIHPEAAFRLTLTEAMPEKSEQAIADLIQPFNLRQTPLIRAGLIRIGEQRHILAVDMHHIISDGTSIQVLVGDFVQMYQGHVLAPLSVQYKDYTEWQHQHAASPAYQRQERYWLDTLSGKLPVLNLPADYPRPSAMSFEGNVLHVELDALLGGQIRQWSQTHQVTWFMTLLAAYYTLLARLTGEEDILVGIPQAGRHHAELKDIVGMFVNTLVLRNRPEASKTFGEFVREIKTSLLSALENQDFPLETVMDRLEIARDPGRNLLYDTIFNYQGMKNKLHDEAALVGNLRISAFPYDPKASKADMTIHLYEAGERICLECFYRTDLFKPETIQYIFDEYRTLLEQVVQDGNRMLCEYPILKQQLIRTKDNRISPVPAYDPFNEHDLDSPLIKRFAEQVNSFPHKTAVKRGMRTVSYGELDRLSNRVARQILQHICTEQEEHTVSMLFGNSIEAIIAILGAVKAGVPFVPIDRSMPSERIAYMVNHAQSSLILTDEEHVTEICNMTEHMQPQPLILIVNENVQDKEDTAPRVTVDQERNVFILFTSGSTGKPKGVMQTHKNVHYYLSRFTSELHVSNLDQIPLLTTYSHAIGILDIFASLLNGATLHLYDFKVDGNMRRFADWLNQEQITLFHAVPSVFRFFMMNVDDSLHLPYIRMILLGGEAVTGVDFGFYKRNFPAPCLFVNFLGCSELMVISFFIADQTMDFRNTAIPAGYAVEGIQPLILKEDGTQADVFQIGELYYRSDYVFSGYWKDDELTAKVRGSNPAAGSGMIYRSGDFGKYLPDGCLTYYGRKDAQVKIRGYRVDLNEIESVLDGLACIRKSVIKFVQAPNEEPYIAAYYVLSEPATENDIMRMLQDKLPPYLIPQAWMRLEAFPVTGPNKIERGSLPPLNLTASAHTERSLPQNEMESKLMGMWTAVLERQDIGVDQAFFELGGHSLRLMQLQNNLETELGMTVELTDLFKYPTIRSLAAFLMDKHDNTAYLHESRQRGEMRRNLLGQRRR